MKKIKFPIVWILLLAAICALTAALAKNIKWVRQEFPMDGSNVSQLRIFSDSGKFFVTERGEWAEQQSAYQLTDYLDALKYLPQAEIGARYPDAQGYLVMLTEGGTPEDFEDVLTYRAGGAGEIDGWQIHLLLIPRYEKAETDAESTEDAAAGTQRLHLFYENAAA